jgi:hypothetical protein
MVQSFSANHSPKSADIIAVRYAQAEFQEKSEGTEQKQLKGVVTVVKRRGKKFRDVFNEL